MKRLIKEMSTFRGFANLLMVYSIFALVKISNGLQNIKIVIYKLFNVAHSVEIDPKLGTKLCYRKDR